MEWVQEISSSESGGISLGRGLVGLGCLPAALSIEPSSF